MTGTQLVALLVLVVVVAVGVLLKYITSKKLSSIDGLGSVRKKGKSKDNVIANFGDDEFGDDEDKKK